MKNSIKNFDWFAKDSNSLAYWMGFIYADGSVNYRNNSIRCVLSINPKDIFHLFDLANTIGLPKDRVKSYSRLNKSWGKIEDKASISFSVPSKIESFSKWGIIPNKTYESFHAPQISLRYLPHFLRGWFDGDGSFSVDNKTNSFRLSTSLEAAHWYSSKLKELGYEGDYKIVPNGNSAINYNVRIDSNLRIYLVGKLLCPESLPRLDRKWNKYKEIERRIENRQYKTPKDLLDHPLSLSPRRKEGQYRYELKL